MNFKKIPLSPEPSDSPNPSTKIYPHQPDTFDELVASDGTIRPHWGDLLKEFESLNSTQRRQARETAALLLKNDGMTYLASHKSQETDRPWQLDLLTYSRC